MVGDKYVCDAMIAVVPAEGTRYWTLESKPSDKVWLRIGLTDDGTPGAYRWSRWAMDKIVSGREPKGTRGSDGNPNVPESLPVTAPCIHGHSNTIDDTVLSR